MDKQPLLVETVNCYLCGYGVVYGMQLTIEQFIDVGRQLVHKGCYEQAVDAYLDACSAAAQEER